MDTEEKSKVWKEYRLEAVFDRAVYGLQPCLKSTLNQRHPICNIRFANDTVLFAENINDLQRNTR